MGIFDKRISFKPFEYPEIVKFKEAINHSYWLVSEWNFTSDIQDFHTKLDDNEREILKRTLLAISQIEVAVKKFWSKLGDRFPKAEFDQVGICFGDSEIRHADAYSHLLQVLGYNHDFELLLENPVIRGRVSYLSKYLSQAFNLSDKDFTKTLTLFSIFIENVSLFSQFAIIKSFNKYKNVLKDIDNVVQATAKEETVHFQFGAWLINKIKQEKPEWFDDKFYLELRKYCIKSYHAEASIIDWIFENGELPFLSKTTLKNFIKKRLNDSLIQIGSEKIFETEQELTKSLAWFDDEVLAEVNVDFFYKKPVTYSKNNKSINAEDLF